MENKYEIEKKTSVPIIAICYDFDKTLSPTDMQAQGFIQNCGIDVNAFWKNSNDMAKNNDMDINLSWMFNMIDNSQGKFYVTKDKLNEYGSKVELYRGVDTWFERINNYGKENGVEIEHYIISSGLKEMIEGTSINKYFKKVYASSFHYGDKRHAIWPAQNINSTNKTQFLFRIEKGVLNINDGRVNDYVCPHDIRIPFNNMIYIGDSDTDIPCMKLVNSHNGYSIGVFDPDKNDKSKVFRMISENRIKYFAKADYSENEELEELVKNIIKNVSTNEKMKKFNYENIKEVDDYYNKLDEETLKKEKLIDDLEESRTFLNTHTVIKEMNKISNWNEKEIDEIITISLLNQQVKLILNDTDICSFVGKLIRKTKNLDNAKKQEIEKILFNNI